ncbi:MAG: MBL fold metallo-hydrolase [Myxococcales bacterium]|nr:MBL fold metallo-hydrolase [Myxococcales bacterium]
MEHDGMIVEGRPVGPFAMNSYLVGCKSTGKAAIIDSGGDTGAMLELAKRHELNVESLLQTHAHIDHVAGLAEMVERTGAPIYLHPADKPLYEAVPAQGRMFGIPIPALPPIDAWLEEGQKVSVGEITFEVWHTPGHAPGHVCFVDPVRRVTFGGDLIFRGSIGRVDLPGADPTVMVASLKRVMDGWDDDMTIYPGHMGSTTMGQERDHNPFLNNLNAVL